MPTSGVDYNTRTKEQLIELIEMIQRDRYKLEEENIKLREERDFFKEQAILWRKDYKNEYEKNRKLEEDLGTVIDERDNAFKKIEQLIERIKELETDYDRLKVAFEDVVSGK